MAKKKGCLALFILAVALWLLCSFLFSPYYTAWQRLSRAGLEAELQGSPLEAYRQYAAVDYTEEDTWIDLVDLKARTLFLSGEHADAVALYRDRAAQWDHPYHETRPVSPSIELHAAIDSRDYEKALALCDLLTSLTQTLGGRPRMVLMTRSGEPIDLEASRRTIYAGDSEGYIVRTHVLRMMNREEAAAEAEERYRDFYRKAIAALKRDE